MSNSFNHCVFFKQLIMTAVEKQSKTLNIGLCKGDRVQ